ncbi:MAG: AraC family transcriptional regulator [bacterium]|nr:AraC family transcriptional regulator [bacterium]
MPHLQRRAVYADDELAVERVACDGCDDPRAREESWPGDRVVVVVRGDFELRHRRGRGFADVQTMLLARGGRPFVMRHPRGRGDVCLSYRGRFVTALCDALDVDEARLVRTGELWSPLVDGAPSASDRQIADAVDYVLAARYDQPLRLPAIAREARVTTFHACRAYKRATGRTIHAALEELRLRHALAALTEGDDPIADIAYACGFANHGHLTNRFRARFGVAPSRVRR